MARALANVAEGVTPAVMEQLNLRAIELLAESDGEASLLVARVLTECGLAADSPEGVAAKAPHQQRSEPQANNYESGAPAKATILATYLVTAQGGKTPRVRRDLIELVGQVVIPEATAEEAAALALQVLEAMDMPVIVPSAPDRQRPFIWPPPFGQQPHLAPPVGGGTLAESGVQQFSNETSSTQRNWPFIILGTAGVAGMLLLGLLYVWAAGTPAVSGGSAQESGTPTLGSTASQSSSDGACSALLSALSKNDLPIEMWVRLDELAKNQSADGNARFFAALNTQLKPTRGLYQQACLSEVEAGRAPTTVRTFLTAFDNAATDGAAIGGQIVAAGVVDPAQAQALGDAARELEQATSALPASYSAFRNPSFIGAARGVPLRP
jgi:hypothetical protein